jgi:osmotically-inducible protein OsmY
MGIVTKLAAIGVAGAAAQYFLDPEQGARRRNEARDRALALVRQGGAEASRKASYAAEQAKGAAQQAKQTVATDEPKPALTDQELAHKVESIIFRDPDAPKGQVNVDAVGTTVTLRGQVDSQEIVDDLERQAKEIPEVGEVENLLHLPGTPAPTR